MLAALLVTLAPLVYFFPAVRGQIVISPDDGVIFNIPLRVAAANLIRAGHFPLWNPYIFSGMPLHGAAQAGLLFPLNWFYLISSPPVATNLMMLATYMVAALGAYLFARRSGADITGPIATSFIWQFSSFWSSRSAIPTFYRLPQCCRGCYGPSKATSRMVHEDAVCYWLHWWQC